MTAFHNIIPQADLYFDESATPHTIDFSSFLFPAGATSKSQIFAPSVIPPGGTGYASNIDFQGGAGQNINVHSAQITIVDDATAEPDEIFKYTYTQHYLLGGDSYQVDYVWTIHIPANGAATNLIGTPGVDVLTGGDGDDILVGLGGNDGLQGQGGNDYLYCGSGNDTADGFNGSDVILGEDGDDIMYGGADQDYLFGGSGTNAFYGGDGVDVLISEGSNDLMDGGEGGDYFYAYGTTTTTAQGFDGNDIFVMQSGSNVAFGGTGQDYFYMGAGDDQMFGGDGVDVLIGGGGNDLFDGGAGTDYLFLGAGKDTVKFNGSSGVDVINNFDPSQDVINLQGSSFAIHSFNQALDATADFGSFSIITFDSQTAIWLIGVAPGQLNAGDFLF